MKVTESHTCKELYEYFDREDIWKDGLIYQFGPDWESIFNLCRDLFQFDFEESRKQYPNTPVIFSKNRVMNAENQPENDI